MSEALKVGTRLVELCQQGKAAEAMQELYAENIISIEGVEALLEGHPEIEVIGSAANGADQDFSASGVFHVTADGVFLLSESASR